jgi:hypothetical protein
MEDNRKSQDPSIPDALEIVELDERLDMAFDPLGIVAGLKPTEPTTPPNTNCMNSSCCGPK